MISWHNVLWTKGRNAMSFGFQYQWLETIPTPRTLLLCS